MAFRNILPILTDLTHSATLSGIDGLSYSKALNGSKPGRQQDPRTPARFELYRLSADVAKRMIWQPDIRRR
ncbi:hypothetical protein [Chitinophaga filiformis]|uniref:Uncharacterized protein n=1 Tax=Chitinophaga filiformis TaxID=104663 RepID=A0ABY4HVT8_CHIFI|nr:hypothetical protein [Chitinophaga filiformis]UPK67573.1 hypothetical protein MYF79_21745 [Chitinophaga filiformis]